MADKVIRINPLDCIANLLIAYYKPIQLIEHKYKTKVIAIGLLKIAQFADAIYLDPYKERLVSYKSLIKDHTDHFKMAEYITINIFSDILNTLFINYLKANTKKDAQLLDQLIIILNAQYENRAQALIHSVRTGFIQKYRKMSEKRLLAHFLMKKYLNKSENYDLLAAMIVKRCLIGVTQEEVEKRIASSVYNYYIYGIYSRVEVTNIYNITFQTPYGIQPMKYFTKIQSLARSIINTVEENKTTVNFFGKIFDPFIDIEKLFSKCPNITLMYY
ncbi:MAG: hypothetical protein JW881_20000 [Spirochaetales bacterium]|nr:hypothetical protein [Spirochaetales bacterium]